MQTNVAHAHSPPVVEHVNLCIVPVVELDPNDGLPATSNKTSTLESMSPSDLLEGVTERGELVDGTACRCSEPSPGKYFRAERNSRVLLDTFLESEAQEVLASVERMLRARGHVSHEIEEIVSETHLAAVVQAEKNGIRSITAFYLRVANMRGITRRRRAAWYRKKFGWLLSVEPSHLPCDASVEHHRRDLVADMSAALSKLPADLADVARQQLDGSTQEETAEALGIPVHTVRYRFRRAREQLAGLLEGYACSGDQDSRAADSAGPSGTRSPRRS